MITKCTSIYYTVYSRGVNALLRDVLWWLEKGGACRWLACINPHSMIVSRDKPVFAEALATADWLVPDGIGIVIGYWFLHKKWVGRITGYDVFYSVLDALNENGGANVFFLGSTPMVLSRICNKISTDFPGICVVGVHSPSFSESFSDNENNQIIEHINCSGATILFVGLTAPKQEMWLSHNSFLLENVRFACAVGAVFDFYAGTVKRSGAAFRKCGLEWLPRLLKEPRRLWPRVFISGPAFLWDLALSLTGFRRPRY